MEIELFSGSGGVRLGSTRQETPNFPRIAGYACGRFCSALQSMGTSHLIELTVQRTNQDDVDVLRSPAWRLRAARLYVRLHPEEQWLLREREGTRKKLEYFLNAP